MSGRLESLLETQSSCCPHRCSKGDRADGREAGETARRSTICFSKGNFLLELARGNSRGTLFLTAFTEIDEFFVPRTTKKGAFSSNLLVMVPLGNLQVECT